MKKEIVVTGTLYSCLEILAIMHRYNVRALERGTLILYYRAGREAKKDIQNAHRRLKNTTFEDGILKYNNAKAILS